MAEELLIKFLKTVPKLIGNLKNTANAEDYSELTRISHDIKGSASNLRIQELAKVCLKLD